MRSGFICFLSSLISINVLAGEASQAKKDLDAMQGTWLVEALEYNGKDFKEKFKISFVVKGEVMTVEGDGAVRKEYGKLSLKLDLSTMPKCVDLRVSDGVQLNATMEGIYELKKDELRLCIKVFGAERPGEFKSPDGASIALLTLKRQNAGGR
jgi:uncharacterized protein (TIGR03067 family)